MKVELATLRPKLLKIGTRIGETAYRVRMACGTAPLNARLLRDAAAPRPTEPVGQAPKAAKPFLPPRDQAQQR